MAKKFEYQVFKEGDLTNIGGGFINDNFIQLGQEGWELVGTIPDPGRSRLYFKREIESPLTHKQERNGYGMSR